MLDPKIIFMNHGSFGACPKPIFDDYQKWQRRLEKQPVLFSTETIYDLFRKSRIALGEFVGCHEDDIVLFQNPTVAVSNVMYSLKLQPHDQVLMSNHEYGALVRAWSMWARSLNVDIVQRNVELPLSSEEALAAVGDVLGTQFVDVSLMCTFDTGMSNAFDAT